MEPPLERSYWIRPGRLLGAALPSAPDPALRRDKLTRLLDGGVRAVVNLMEEHELDHSGRLFAPYEPDFHALAAERGTAVLTLRHPIRDLGIPTRDGMRAILDTVDEALSAGAVAVHCWGGVGRTGTVAACWLLRHGHATRENVLDVLAELRRADRVAGRRPAPEAREQVRFVLEWPEGPSGAAGR